MSSSCSASELPKSAPSAMPGGAHQPGDRRRQLGRVRRRRRRRAERRRRVLGAVRGAVLGAGGELVRRRRRRSPRRARTSRRSRRRRSAPDRAMRPFAASPAAGRERGAAHDPRGPDVAVDAALVAQPVQQPRLAEELVELVLVLRGHLGADRRRSAPRRRRPSAPALDGGPDRAQQHVGQLERDGSEMSKPSSRRLPTRSR